MGSFLVARNHIPDIGSSPADQHALLSLCGELDIATAPQLSAQLAELADRKVRHVAMDLTGLRFMDSSGLALFLAEHQRVESLGGELIILSPPRQVRRLFDVCGLSDYFNVRPVTEAVLNNEAVLN
jgi:anti-sigma B factor antagonist